MAKEIYISSKDIPRVTEVNNGTYFFIQTPTGLKLVDYGDLIWSRDNTLVTATVDQNTNSILALSSEFTSTTQSLSEEIKTVKVNSTYIGYTNIIIEKNKSSWSGQLSPTPTKTLTPKDIIIVPANEYAAKFNAYVTKVEGSLVTIQGTFNKNIIINTDITFGMGLSAGTTTEKLSTFTSQQYLSSTIVNPTDINTLVSNLALSTISINAEENAEYNIFVVK